MMARRFRKKPVIIEAIQYECPDQPRTSGNVAEIQEFGAVVEPSGPWDPPANGDLIVKTLEGPFTASPGDFIIRGVQGEFYPCKPDIFEATYEEVS